MALRLILRVLATLINAPLLLLGLYAIFADRSADNPPLQVFFALVAIMALLNIIVPWCWRSAHPYAFSFVYRLCRCFAWALNVVIFAFVVFGAVGLGDARILFMIFPSGLGLLALFITGQKQKVLLFDEEVEGLPAVAIVRDTQAEPLLSDKITIEAPATESPPAEVPVTEVLPTEQVEEDALDKILDCAAAQKKVSIITLPLILLGTYYMNAGSFIPSLEWIIFCAALALGFAYPLARMGEESLRVPHRRFSLRPGDFKWLVLITAGFLFFTVSYGVGYVLNGLTGYNTLASLSYTKRDVEKQCVNVIGETGQLATQYCLRREDIAYLPDRGQLQFKARRSWFGLSIQGYVMPLR